MTKLHRFVSLAVSSLAVVVLAVGCGAASSLPPETIYPVQGKVVLPNGKPVTEGTVQFYPVKAGHAASGKINADGTFTLETPDIGPGAPAGEFTVVVQAPVTMAPGKGDPKDIKSSVPAKFQDQDTSTLKQTVKPESNDLTITLK
jgi:hypothetical protein